MITNNNIRLRLADLGDWQFYYDIKCEKDNQYWSGHREEPDYQKLKRWFFDRVGQQESALARKIFIIESSEPNEQAMKLGYVYLDITSDISESCEYAVAICERFYGHGIAAVAITLAIKIAINIELKNHYAYIRKDNERSQRLFRKVGFKNTGGEKTHFIDNIVAPSNTAFNEWINSYGLNGEDAALLFDYDTDGYNNLFEFSCGGNPTNPADRGIRPSFSVVSNQFYFSYNTRMEGGACFYLPALCTNLTAASWTNANYETTGLSANNGRPTIINRIQGHPSSVFFRLTVSTTPFIDH